MWINKCWNFYKRYTYQILEIKRVIKSGLINQFINKKKIKGEKSTEPTIAHAKTVLIVIKKQKD